MFKIFRYLGIETFWTLKPITFMYECETCSTIMMYFLYREAALLWDEKQSSNRYNQRITTVIAHEFTHQWFGDLVTCDWWSEIFLNEGFATYFEYHIANEVTL